MNPKCFQSVHLWSTNTISCHNQIGPSLDVYMFSKEAAYGCFNLCDGLVHYINGLVQDCSNSSALAMELLQSCTESWVLSVDGVFLF